MRKTLELDYTQEAWLSFDNVKICLGKIDTFFGKRDYSKKLKITFSDKPLKKKGQKIFVVDVYGDEMCLIFAKFHILLYRSFGKWLKNTFSHLKDNDKLYVIVSQ